MAAQASSGDSSAAALLEGALAGGRSATSRALGAIELGHRADFLVLDAMSPALLGVPGDQLLDALVFSSPDARCQDVFVAGHQVVLRKQLCDDSSGSPLWPGLAQNFVETMKALWAH